MTEHTPSGFLAGLTGENGIFRVRSLFTLAMVGGFVYGFLDEMIPSEVFVPVLASVVSYYFGSRSA